jgi:hypothetical protein
MNLDKPYSGMVPLVDKDGNPFEIKLPEPEGDKNKIRVDVSDQLLLIPKP